VRDRQTATTRRVTLQSGVELDDHSFQPRVSFDGRWVTFGTQAANLVAEDALHDPDQYLWDAQTGALELVSVGLDGHGAGGILWGSGGCGISADGRYVAFATPAPNVCRATATRARRVRARRRRGHDRALERELDGRRERRLRPLSLAQQRRPRRRLPQLRHHPRAGNERPLHVFAHDAQASTPTSYCTAKVNSHGCTSAMASAGSRALPRRRRSR
jgi:hypothetical protein